MNLGIDKIKDVFTFLFGGYNCYEAVMADNKVNWKDLPHIVALIPSVVTVIGDAPEALDQGADLTPEEITELETWAKDEFDIPDDLLEAKIEEGLSICADIGKIGIRVGNFVKNL